MRPLIAFLETSYSIKETKAEAKLAFQTAHVSDPNAFLPVARLAQIALSKEEHELAWTHYQNANSLAECEWQRADALQGLIECAALTGRTNVDDLTEQARQLGLDFASDAN